MLSEATKKKLDAYFGFALKKRTTFAGMQLEDELARKRISVLIITKECSPANEEKLKRHASVNPSIKILRYEGEYDIPKALGYEKLKAIGIGDIHLGKAIYETLLNEKEAIHE